MVDVNFKVEVFPHVPIIRFRTKCVYDNFLEVYTSIIMFPKSGHFFLEQPVVI